MAIEIECDSCHHSYRVADTMAGKRLRCKQCGKVILVPAFASPPGTGDEGADDDPLKAISNLSEAGSSSGSGLLGGAPAEPEWTSDVNPWDIPASMAEIRGRLSARPTTPFAYPMSDLVDAFLPWVLIGVFLGPALVTAVRGVLASAGEQQLVQWVQLALAAALFCLLVIPLTIRALRSAGRSFKFRVPDQAYFRIFAAFSVAIGMGSFFYAQLGWQGFYFGFGLGAFVGALLLGVLFHLLPVEIFFTGLFTVGFFLVTSTVSYYAVTGARPLVNLLAAEAAPKKTIAKAPAKPPAPAAHNLAPSIALLPAEPPKPVAPAPTSVPATEPAPPKPAVPETPAVTLKTNSAAAQDVVVLDRPRDFDAMLYPLTPAGGGAAAGGAGGGATVCMGSIRRTSTDDAVDIWSLNPLPIVRATLPLKRQANVSDRYAISPAGDLFARLISWPKLAVQLISVESQKTRTLELDASFGQPEVFGFTAPDTLAVRFQRNGMAGMELWDLGALPAPRVKRQVPLPADLPRGLAVSPDGKLAACAVPADPSRDPHNALATVQVIDLGIGRVTRRLSITGLDPKLPLTVAGLAFSPDNAKVALLCENSDNLLIEIWDLRAGSVRPSGEHVFAAGQLPLSDLSHFPGRCFDWLGDGRALLLYGNVIIDAPTGAMLASFDFPDIRSQQVVSADTLQLEFQHPGEQKALARVTLNPQALDEARKK